MLRFAYQARLALFGVVFFCLTLLNCFASPSNSISYPNTFVNGTIADADQVNSDFNEAQTKYNAHTHTDLTSLGTITTGTWAADIIGTLYGGTGQNFGSVASNNIMYFSSTGVLSSGKLNLSSMVTGTLPVGNGGTGATANANAANGVVVLDASAYVPASSVNTSALKTTTGEVSVTGNSRTLNTLPGGQYGFYPQFKKSSGTSQSSVDFVGVNASPADISTSYTTYCDMQEQGVGIVLTGIQRYVTSSGEDLWIFLLIDKNTKSIIAAYQAPDHPAYGNGGDFDKLSHPFGSYDQTKHEIVLVDKVTCESIKNESKATGKSILTIVNEEYKPDMKTEEVYQPLHSGKFLTDDNKQVREMVTSIPDYIKVRPLIKK